MGKEIEVELGCRNCNTPFYTYAADERCVGVALGGEVNAHCQFCGEVLFLERFLPEGYEPGWSFIREVEK